MAGEITAMLKGVQTNTARALNAHKLRLGRPEGASLTERARQGIARSTGRATESAPKAPKSFPKGMDAEDVITSAGGRKKIKEMIRLVVIEDTAGNTSGANKLVRRFATTKHAGRAVSWYVSSLISGPTTLVKNAASGPLMMGLQLTNDFATGVVNSAKLAVGKGDADGITLGDAIAEVQSVYGSLVESAMVMGRMLGYEAPGHYLAKNELVHNPLVAAARGFSENTSQIGHASKFGALAPGNKPDEDAGAALRFLDNVMQVPGRVLIGTDELFKGFFIRMEMARIVNMEIRQRGLTGQRAASVMRRRLREPSDELYIAGLKQAEKNTFTAPLTSKFGKAMQSFSRSHGVARAILPFVRTPGNIFKETANLTPLGLAQSSLRNTLRNGTKVQRQRIQGQMAIGTGIFAYIASAVAEGKIIGSSGGSQAARDAGKQAYSMVSEDENGNKTYTRLDFLEPFGSLIAVAADITEASGYLSDGDLARMSGAWMTSFLKAAGSRTMMYGIVKAMDALNAGMNGGPLNGPKAIARYMNRTLAAFVPNTLAQARRAQDPVMRQTRGLMDEMTNRIPWLAQRSLFPQLNLFGEEVQYPSGADNSIVNPFITTTGTDDTVKLELDRITAELDDDIRMPSQRISTNVELSPEEYNYMIKMMNQDGDLKEDLKDIVTDTDMSDELKLREVNRTIAARAQAGRFEVFEKFPEVEEQYMIDLENKENKLLGEPLLPDKRPSPAGYLNQLLEAFLPNEAPDESNPLQ
jgi:hypothetical protein